MKTIDAALMCADNMRTTIDAEGFACAEDFALVCLAAEVRRLQAENERLRGWIRVEGGCNNTCTRQILGEVCHGCKCGKTLPETAP